MERRGKYNARPTEADGYRFASALESRRYQQLKLLLAAGEISGLTVHPRIELLPAGRDVCGERLRAVYYVGDFGYLDKDGKSWVEDTKGVETDVFRLKVALLKRFQPYVRLRVVRKEDM